MGLKVWVMFETIMSNASGCDLVIKQSFSWCVVGIFLPV